MKGGVEGGDKKASEGFTPQPLLIMGRIFPAG
jgi:hypothetical protein